MEWKLFEINVTAATTNAQRLMLLLFWLVSDSSVNITSAQILRAWNIEYWLSDLYLCNKNIHCIQLLSNVSHIKRLYNTLFGGLGTEYAMIKYSKLKLDGKRKGTLYKISDLLFNDQVCGVCQNMYYKIKSKLVFFFSLRVMTQLTLYNILAVQFNSPQKWNSK